MSSTPNDQVSDPAGLAFSIKIIFIILPTISVIVRLWSRWIAHSVGFGMDDWYCLVAFVFHIAIYSISQSIGHHGMGHHVTDLSPQDIELLLKLLWVNYFLFYISLGAVKFSALLLYRKVFESHSRWFNTAILSAELLTVAWTMYGVISTLFQCSPVEKAWKRDMPGHCINMEAWYLSSSVWEVLLDIYILVLPMPIVWGLQMSLSRKALVALAFVCGYSSVVATIGRVVTTVKTGDGFDTDFTWNATPVILWSFAETTFSIVSVCLPSWFWLFRRAANHGVKSLFVSTPVPRVAQKRAENAPPQWRRHKARDFSKLGAESECYSVESETVGEARQTSSAAMTPVDVLSNPDSMWMRREADIELRTVEKAREF